METFKLTEEEGGGDSGSNGSDGQRFRMKTCSRVCLDFRWRQPCMSARVPSPSSTLRGVNRVRSGEKSPIVVLSVNWPACDGGLQR